MSSEAVRYALRQVGLRTGAPIDPNRARLMGGHIEALDACLRVYLFQEQGRPVSELEIEKLCRKAIAADPDCEPACHELAGQLDPDDTDCQVDRARVCAARGRLEEAAAVLEKTVLLDRTSAIAHASLAIVHSLRQQRDAALRELQEGRRRPDQ